MEPIYLLEAVSSALPASFPGTGLWAPSAEETETRVEYERAREELCRLITSQNSFTILPIFDFFAVDEGWSRSAMSQPMVRQIGI